MHGSKLWLVEYQNMIFGTLQKSIKISVDVTLWPHRNPWLRLSGSSLGLSLYSNDVVVPTRVGVSNHIFVISVARKKDWIKKNKLPQ